MLIFTAIAVVLSGQASRFHGHTSPHGFYKVSMLIPLGAADDGLASGHLTGNTPW